MTARNAFANLATEAKQDVAIAAMATLAGYLDGVEGGLASVLAKLSGDPATQATLAAVLAKLSGDPATQTTLAAVLAKISGDPATQATLAAILAALPASLGVKVASGSLSVAPASDALFSTKTDGVADGARTLGWDGSAVSAAGFSAAYLEVTAMGTATSIVTKAGVGSAYTIDVINTNGSSSISSITAPGLYLIPYAVGNLTLTGLGTAVVNLILKR